jgi:Rad3-related DNA helicase
VYQKAREEWESSSLLVVNHALLCTNLQMGRVHLPVFAMLIVDEAHSFPGTAARHFGFELDSRSFPHYLRNAFETHNESLTSLFTDKAFTDNIRSCMEKVIRESHSFFTRLFSEGAEQTRRLRNALPEGRVFLQALRELATLTEDSRELVAEEKLYIPEGILSRLADALMALVHVVEVFDQEWVYWAERDRDSILDGKLVGQPVEVAAKLQHDLYGYYRNIVFTSATLSSGKGFGYMARHLGLHEYQELQVQSPFNYKDNMRVYVPEAIPNTKESRFPDIAARIIAGIANVLGGRTLVLCTSYRMMHNLREQMIRHTELDIILHLLRILSGIQRFSEQPMRFRWWREFVLAGY